MRQNSVPPKMHTGGFVHYKCNAGVAQLTHLEHPSESVLPPRCPEFKNFNDRTFRDPNMQTILDMLEGKPNAKTWNNIHNASMHVMLKWDEAQLQEKICPSIDVSFRFCPAYTKADWLSS